jgi:hypothetical protein
MFMVVLTFILILAHGEPPETRRLRRDRDNGEVPVSPKKKYSFLAEGYVKIQFLRDGPGAGVNGRRGSSSVLPFDRKEVSHGI